MMSSDGRLQPEVMAMFAFGLADHCALPADPLHRRAPAIEASDAQPEPVESDIAENHSPVAEEHINETASSAAVVGPSTPEERTGMERVVQHYPDLAGLDGWSWSWVGGGATSVLIGYKPDADGATDLLYVDGVEQAAIIHTDSSGVPRRHETGSLERVLDVLPASAWAGSRD